jgi:beta-galactosidase
MRTALVVAKSRRQDFSDRKEGTARFMLRNVKKWTAETPYLYTLLATVKDSKGNVVEVIPQKVGFRKVEIKNSSCSSTASPCSSRVPTATRWIPTAAMSSPRNA